MGNLIYVWLAGVAILFVTEMYLYKGLLKNPAPGVQRKNIWLGLPGWGGRFAAFIERELFSATGQKYRVLLIWNESIYAVWIFFAGPILLALSKS
jgi:hypothetical protein